MDDNSTSFADLARVGGLLAGVVTVALTVAGRIHTSKPNEWLVRTGLLLTDAQARKTFFRWPFQHVRTVSMQGHTFRLTVTSMTSEKLSIEVPMTWSVAVGDTEEHVTAFARRVAEDTKLTGWANEIILPTLTGESRAIAANLKVEELFTARADFAKQVQANVEPVLAQFGLVVLNASVTELSDGPGSKYFSALAETISAQAHNKAVAEVAAANRDGTMAAKAREGETRIQNAQIEADTKAAEGANDQAVLKVQAAVAVTAAEQELLANTARISATQGAAKLEQERLADVARANVVRETEVQRGRALAPAVVAAEIATAEAKGQADAVRIAAAAQLDKAKAEGDAVAYAGETAAQAAKAMLAAQADGVTNLLDAFAGDAKAAVAYLALEKGTWGELARAQAAALQGLNPRITVWAPDGKAAMDPLRQLGGTLPPLFEALALQTGLDVPALLKTAVGGHAPSTPALLKGGHALSAPAPSESWGAADDTSTTPIGTTPAPPYHKASKAFGCAPSSVQSKHMDGSAVAGTTPTVPAAPFELR